VNTASGKDDHHQTTTMFDSSESIESEIAFARELVASEAAATGSSSSTAEFTPQLDRNDVLSVHGELVNREEQQRLRLRQRRREPIARKVVLCDGKKTVSVRPFDTLERVQLSGTRLDTVNEGAFGSQKV
jgi:hypothetical protein